MREWRGKHWRRWRAAGATACTLILLSTGVACARTASAGIGHGVVPAAPDIAVAPYVFCCGVELLRLLDAVAAVAPQGFGRAERRRIFADARALAGPGAFGRTQPTARSHALTLGVRGQDHVVALVVRAVDREYVDLEFSAADTALTGAIRAAIRAAYLDSLEPLQPAQLRVEEHPGRLGGRPAITLAMATAKEFGCLNYRIVTRFARRGDTLALHGEGIMLPHGTCAPAPGPARMRRRLDVAPGRYVLQVDYRGDTNVFALTVTDRSLAVAPRRATVLTADTRLRWRVPRNSFVLRCYPGGASGALCADLHRWVARQRGIARVALGDAGLSPYGDGTPGNMTGATATRARAPWVRCAAA